MKLTPRTQRDLLGIVILLICFVVQSTLGDEAKKPSSDKPKVAFLPLGGDANEELRGKVGFALRQKLDRTKKYEVLDGYAMNDLASEAKTPITFATGEDEIRKLGKYVDASIVGWGELNNAPAG